MLNLKMLNSRDPSHVVCEIGQRLEGNQVEMVQGVHSVCARTPGQEELIQQMMGVCKLPRQSLHRIKIRRVSSTSMTFRNIVFKHLFT